MPAERFELNPPFFMKKFLLEDAIMAFMYVVQLAMIGTRLVFDVTAPLSATHHRGIGVILMVAAAFLFCFEINIYRVGIAGFEHKDYKTCLQWYNYRLLACAVEFCICTISYGGGIGLNFRAMGLSMVYHSCEMWIAQQFLKKLESAANALKAAAKDE